MCNTFLRMENIHKRYRLQGGFFSLGNAEVHALCGVNLDVYKGETLGLVGESGCGKSTLARVLLRLEEPSEGTFYLEGKDIRQYYGKEKLSFSKIMQMVFQDPFSSLNPKRTVAAAIAEPLVIHGVDSGTRKKKVEELLGLVGLLPEHGGRYPHELSGGQRQRVAIARALALSPQCLVCDEAVSALDVSVQAQILNLLSRLQEKLGLTSLFISHDLSVVAYMSDRVAIMYLGRIVELAAARDIYNTPLHPYTKALLQAIPVPDPLMKSMGHSSHGSLPGNIALPKGCSFYPRCPQAQEVCLKVFPETKTLHGNRSVACHLYG